MQIRDRIKALRRVRAGELRPNPRNWRIHGQQQHDVLRGILAEVGYASALLARELPDGSLELIDGHLRAETTPDMEVPVLVLDLDEREAAILLAVHDPLAGMAEADQDALQSLLAEVDTANDAVRSWLDSLANKPETPLPAEDDEEPLENADVPELYQVIIECRNEAEQQAVFERLNGEGYQCKLLML